MMVKAPLWYSRSRGLAAFSRKAFPDVRACLGFPVVKSPPFNKRSTAWTAMSTEVHPDKHLFHLFTDHGVSYVFLPLKPLLRSLFRSFLSTKRDVLENESWAEDVDWPNSVDMRVGESAYAKLLRLSGSAKDLPLGKRLHLHIIRSGHDPTVLLGNLLVQMYSKCGAMEDAMAVFGGMCVRNVFSWTLIMEAYAKEGQFGKAAQLFEEMEKSSTTPDAVTFVIMISACADGAALDEGMRLHSSLIDRGHESEVIIGNALVNLYGKCCSLEDARRAFDMACAHTVVSWNTMIGVYFQCEQVEEALQLFQQMYAEGVLPDKYTYVSILNVCANQTNLAEGKQLHGLIVHGAFQSDMVVRTALIKMYSNRGSLVESHRLFDMMDRRDIVAWNTMIAAYAQHVQGDSVLGLSQQMHAEGVMPDKVTFLSLLSMCADLKALDVGKQVHVCIINRDYESDVSVGNGLITMYGKCGKIGYAQEVFDRMPERDVVSWNTLIMAYVQKGQGPSKMALQVFQQMQLEGVIPNKVTFVGLFDLCSSQAGAPECCLLHTFILGSDLELDVTVGNAIVNMYGKCGNVRKAQKMFHKMSERDEFAWNAMIAAHVQHGQGRGAIELFQQMRMEGVVANKVTCVSILDFCANDANLAEGKRVHVQIVSNSFETDVAVATALFDMYGKCGVAEAARSSFDVMTERDVVSWNAMGKVYSQHGMGIEALQLFQQMQRADMAPNNSTFSSVLSACSHAGLVFEGCCCFSFITHEYGMVPTLKQYNVMIDLLGRAGQLDEVEYLIYSMPCQPSAASWLTLLDACRKYSDSRRGKCAAEHIFELHPANFAAHILISNIWVASNWAATEV